MNVLLVYPPYSYPCKNPPIGLAYLASYIRSRGHSVTITDLNLGRDTMAGLGRRIAADNVKVVGLSFMTCQHGAALRLARWVKSLDPGIRVVVGGPHASSLPAATLRASPDIDFAVVGEGEDAFAKLLDALAVGSGAEGLPGVAFRQGGRVVVNPRGDLIAEVDSLPFPAWDLLDLPGYSVHSSGADAAATTFAMLSSRGCPNQCTFCDSHTIFERRFRGRSADNIFAEIMHLHRTYGMRQFDFVDDLVTLNKERMLRLCALLQESGVGFSWMANARVNTVDREMLASMKAAGVRRIDFGVETADENVRRLTRKGITNEQIIRAHRLCQELGIATSTFLMVGNLGEDRDSVRRTADSMRGLVEDACISIACPYPGTELYQVAKARGWLNTEDWDRYVTSPTYLKDYRPVMRTDMMDEEEILEAFYFLHSFFVSRKFKSRYGRFFYANPRFWRSWVLAGGLSNRLRMALRLLRARVLAGGS